MDPQVEEMMRWRPRAFRVRCSWPTSGFASVWMISLALALAGCGERAANEAASPETALKQFFGAVAGGDAERVWAFVDDDTRALLTERAERYEELAGGSGGSLRARQPGSFLRAAWVPSEAEIDTLERVDESEDYVVLELTTYMEHTSRIRMLRDGDGWRVDVRSPVEESGEPSPASEPPGDGG